MIACNRPLERKNADFFGPAYQAEHRQQTYYQATPFASAVMARANGGFVCLEFKP